MNKNEIYTEIQHRDYKATTTKKRLKNRGKRQIIFKGTTIKPAAVFSITTMGDKAHCSKFWRGQRENKLATYILHQGKLLFKSQSETRIFAGK